MARKLAAAKGRDESEIGPGRPRADENRSLRTNLTHGRGINSDHLLRRLARDHPEIMRQWESGAFPTVRAAARQAQKQVILKRG
jgi:hypothetical protein